MKRILALLLAVLMVTSVMVFTTAAEETTTTLPTTEFIPIVTEDSMPVADCDYAALSTGTIGGIVWRSVGTSSRISYENDSKAVCLTFEAGATDKTGFHFKCSPWQSYKGMTTLGFDLYISKVAAADVNGKWKMHLITTGGEATLNASLSELAVWSGITLKDGWNRFEIPVGCFNKASTTMTLKEFKFYKNNGNAMGDVTFKLKNVYFADTIVPTVMSSSFGSLTGGADVNSTTMPTKPYMSSVGGATVTYNAGQDYACAQYSKSGLVPNGYGFRIDTSWAEMDITAMNKLCFDLYLSNIDYVNTAAQWRVQLMFTDKETGTAENASNTNTTLANYAKMSGITLKTGWNHFELPMTKQGDSTVGLIWAASHNVAEKGLKYIRIYTNDTANQIGADGKTLTVGLKNVYFANDGIEWATAPTTKLLMDTDMATMTAAEQADATTWHGSVKPQLRKYGGTDVLFYDTVNKGLGFKVTGSVTNTYGIQVKVANTDITGMTKLHFDMYLSDVDHFVANGGAWKIQLTTTESDASLDTNNTTGSIAINSMTLAPYSGGTLTNGWNHIEIPLSDLVNKSNDATNIMTEFIIHKRNNDAYGAAGEDTTVLINNLYLEGDLPTAGVAKVAKAQASLTDCFNLAYTVSADDQIAYKPIVDVTFGGVTTRQPLTADGKYDFNGILAHRLSETITTTVTAMDKNGDILKTTHTYSIMDYCRNMLALESIEGYSADQLNALKRLLSNILYYGAAAQTAIDYNMESVASNVGGILDKITPDAEEIATYTIASPVTDTRDQTAKDAAVATWRSASLVLDSAVAIRYSFSVKEGADVPVVKVGSDEYTPVLNEETGYYYVDVPVYAGQFADEFVASFGDDTTYTATYSVNAYVARCYDKYEEGTTMHELLGAIYNYGASAEAYVTAMSGSAE